MNFYLGIDFGTSGARAIAIDQQANIQSQTKCSYEINDLSTWRLALWELISAIPLKIKRRLRAIAIDGTSSTVLLCDILGNPIPEFTQPLLYNDDRAIAVMESVKKIAPAEHIALSSTSSLAKLVWLTENLSLESIPFCFLHQADWLGFLLHGKLGISDYHNALKLGYDVESLRYPDWLTSWRFAHFLPKVLAPGNLIGKVTPETAARLNLNSQCWICAGTTDSNAAFLAAVNNFSPQVGEAVTCLGSTLVLKVLSKTRIDNQQYGIYSHRFAENLWLVGGASNTGGAVLRQFFSDGDLQSLSSQIPTDRPSSLDYYPLVKMGERFPINDSNLQPRLQPHPDNRVEFLHGLLESIARIESKGYQLLQTLGASLPQRIYTSGGGAQNLAWTEIRKRYLSVPILLAIQTEAAYGSALLARNSLVNL